MAATGAITFPTACKPGQPLPEMLSSLADKKALREIGHEYLKQYPAEKNQLQDLVIQSNVQTDFSKGNIVVIKGWVLSVTEARQCALLTL